MSADKKAALEAEENVILASLERDIDRMRIDAERLRPWIADAKTDKPPPVDIGRAAFDVQQHVLALYRVRLWRKRFG